MAPITLLTALPIFSTAEQHAEFQSRTPASGDFTHDPVLHHLEKGARITLEPSVDGFDAVTMSQLDVYVTEGAVSFFEPSSSRGFSVPYPTISLHAISRQPILADPSASAAHPQPSVSSNGHGDAAATTTERPCVYCQLDENEGADYDNLPEDELAETRELCIFHTDSAAVSIIYAAMSKCASLHPSSDPSSGGPLGLGESGSTEPDWDELMRQANANSSSGAGGENDDATADADEGNDLTEAGRVRVDYATPSARFNPY